jgi:hypothetical protein
MVSVMCRSFAFAAFALGAFGVSACTITMGTGGGAQQPQPVYYVESSGGGAPAPQPQPQPQQTPIQVGASGPVTQPTPVYTPSQIPPVQGPRHVGTPGLTHGGLPVLPRGSTFGGDGNTFRGNLYWVPVGAQSMPNFASLTPQAVTFTDHFNIPLSNSQGSLPPWPDRVEGFGLEYTGTFTATTAGSYDFVVYSDDGAIVYVDGKLVTNDDGIHDPQRADGKVTLAAGPHTIKVDYYLAYRWTVELSILVIPPSGNQELFGPQI